MKHILIVIGLLLLAVSFGLMLANAQDKTVEPIWRTNSYWRQYPLPDHWECPEGYEQVSADGKTVISSGGGGFQSKTPKPTCRKEKLPIEKQTKTKEQVWVTTGTTANFVSISNDFGNAILTIRCKNPKRGLSSWNLDCGEEGLLIEITNAKTTCIGCDTGREQRISALESRVAELEKKLTEKKP